MFRRTPGFDTLAVHAGAQKDPAICALSGLNARGATSSRSINLHQGRLEERMAALEGGTAAIATASGHTAQLLVFHTLMRPGDNFVAASKIYDGSINRFSHAFANFGWQVRWADLADLKSFKAAIDDNTRAIFIESLTHPDSVFVDIEAVAQLAQHHGLPLIVDNTMASPYLLRPIEHGADIVVHSLTRFIAGDGNSMGGIIVDCGTFDWSKSGNYPMMSQPRSEYDGAVLHEAFGNQAFAIACQMSGLDDFGLSLSPDNAFHIATGLETLSLRMQRHCDNALKVAEWLKGHDKVAWVSYPGLGDDPNHALQQKYAPKGAGAVVTFGLRGGFEATLRMVEGVEMISHTAIIGDTRSLIFHPASTAGADSAPDVVRLSIGIEDAADIIADLEQTLAKT